MTAGTRLQDRYLIQKAIKSGGMGAVFLAFDERLQGPCAVKEMHSSQDEWATRRFREEATTLSKLQHSGVPKVRDFFVQGGLHYLVMDYLEGHNLNDEIGSLKAVQARQDLLDVLSILDHLHNLDPAILHRDIKPSNLIRESQTDRLFLVDFGLARSLDDKTQTTAGTAMFCPPEQMLGKATFRSDLYSLAATYYVLLTGREVQMGSCKPILFHQPDLPPELAQVLDKAMQLDPDLRYASAREMRQALTTPMVAATGRSGLALALTSLCLAGLWWVTRPSPLPVSPPTPSPSAAPVECNLPRIVFAAEQVYWGRAVRPGEQPEAALNQVVEQIAGQGLSGRPVLDYDSHQRVLQVGVLLPEKAAAPTGLSPLKLPDGNLAWLVVTGDYQQLPAEREKTRRWIAEQGYKPGNRFYEIRRIGESTQAKSERWETDLCWSMER